MSMTNARRFAAYCETCDWQGPTRPDTLRAVSDYDRHLASTRHRAVLSDTAPTQGDLLVVPFSDTLRAIVSLDGLTDSPDVYEVRDTAGDIWLVERAPAYDEHGHRAWLAV